MAAIVWWFKLLPLAFLALALGRLIYRQQTFKRCLQCLEILYSSQKAKHFLYRLRDSEIKQFSRLPPLKVHEFIDQAARQSFRWQFLKAIYTRSS